MVKCIIFDNNGVLTTSDDEGTLDNVATFLGLEKQKLKPVWNEAAKGLDEGKILIQDFYNQILKYFQLEAKIDDLKKVHFGSYKLKQNMVRYAAQLSKRYKLAMLTNFSHCFDECNQEWRLDNLFGENIFVSAKLGMRKPNPEIFNLVLEKLGIKPFEAIFIDDNLTNIEAAREIGLEAILFTDHDNLYGILGK